MMLNKFIVAAFVLGMANGAVLPSLPKDWSLNNRIVGGEETTIEDIPYQIMLLYYRDDSGLFLPSCGGSIIREDIILNAAHCTLISPSRMRVRAGSTYSTSGGQLRDIARVINQDYNHITIDNDISLIILESPLIIDGITTAIIPLPEQDQYVAAGSLGVVSGWGRTSDGGNVSEILKKLTLPALSQDVCREIYDGINEVTDGMICAAYLGEEGMSACNQDSGGPYVIDGVQIGVVSWGFGCGSAQYPTVLARVPYFRSWIDEQIAQI